MMVAGTGFSQKSRKTNKSLGVVSLSDTLERFSDSKFFTFPNLNKIPYYRNESKLKTIRKLDDQQKWEELYPVLREYVSNFGVINFYRDTYFLWRLGKLTEVYGNLSEAKLLYKLVLKHHREDIDIRSIELYYEELTENDRDYFVPLEYYYELVDYRKEIDTLRPPRSVLLNMGSTVNSDLSDYGPTLSGNDDELIFTSKRNSHNRGLDPVHDEDLFYTTNEFDSWGKAKEFEGINTQYNEGSATISKDGNTLFFARCNAPDGLGDCDIYWAKKQLDDKWGEVENLGINVNSIAWDSHPSLSHSEDTLYFASDRLGGFGLSDLYYTVKNGDNSWGKAVNLGPIINTRNSEVSPFYHHVYEVLYFSSNGQNLNFGEFDIYKSYHDGLNWGEPKNIGPLVNGPGSEFYFTIDSKSEDLYYARSVENNMNNLDLYSFPLPMEAQPGANTTITGSLINEETKQPFKGIVSIIDLDNGIEVAPKFLRPDGSFQFDLINNNNYLLILQGEEFFRIEEIFYLDGELQLNKTTKPISSRLKFESIEFEEGKAEMSTPMYNDLDKLGDFLLDNPDFKLHISGHTDSNGREEFNLKLSQERADIIKEYLVYFGNVPEDRITARGYGSSKPVKGVDHTKPLNRRVEFEIYKGHQTPQYEK
ncbi:OmpA family protein [Fulvivirga lutea]|uniref:OmpA family protein n=1 Tax=Fulvivirga lutea TaxID=2810512 RepID=A0A974WL94_9BACT|nr:OmpA family protein [Fulvivirga lutea]QSE97443.1 OmpA family protein [Fulvivirga lutea]